MGVVRTGLWNYFRASAIAPLYVDLAGARFYYSEAAEQPTLPYCVFHVFNEIHDFTFDLEFGESLVQFDYYGSTADECDDGIADIKTMFDYAIITLSGYTCLKMERDIIFQPGKLQPHDIWQGIARYTLLMKKD